MSFSFRTRMNGRHHALVRFPLFLRWVQIVVYNIVKKIPLISLGIHVIFDLNIRCSFIKLSAKFLRIILRCFGAALGLANSNNIWAFISLIFKTPHNKKAAHGHFLLYEMPNTKHTFCQPYRHLLLLSYNPK